MRDPFPFAPPAWLTRAVQPFAEYFSLHTLPLHIHEVLFAFSLYYITNKVISPAFSNFFWPRRYNAFNARTKLNWDVHIVSFVQSTLICVLALWVIWSDEERSEMNYMGKVHGYTGASGLIQAFAGGYFVWDLMITLQNMHIFGPGMLAHAVSALFVFSLGFRPFVNYYAPTFILYELSSPFLNIHWICDKLNMTGSKIQLYNGIILLFTFFGCRLCWGTYQSVRVFYDVYRAIFTPHLALNDPEFSNLSNGTVVDVPQSEIMQFAGDRHVPIWLAGCYLASNLTLNGLNWFWFGKMIETLRKRFDPPLGTRGPEEKGAVEDQVLVEGTHVETPPPSLPTTPKPVDEAEDYIGAVKLEKSGKHLEVEQLEIRKRVGGKGNGTISTARAA
ncbi:DUF887-domain-containing protein [Lentithecium fluviatile CBS 122367]|uniref:DUF887-domain-containing protein n=1 Tax=Lentithecium fluviatile CBS 122367 TaxID=1168545 RepID=A0A6G1JIV0_9PLEO|nr:DUF887-domain-containing protein [Lentithecium fluviatile CBS 122367]